MIIENIIKNIESIDWASFVGSPWYKPDQVAKVLIRLATIEKDSEIYAESVGHAVLSTIGNDHCGTYYPAILSALDILIEIAEQPENELASQCALGILYDLCGFYPDLEGYPHIDHAELKNWVDEKLKPYNDDNMTH